jgi:hypothetical protein
MSFTELFDFLNDWVRGNLPVAIGGGVGLVVLILLYIQHRPRPKSTAEQLAEVAAAAASSSTTVSAPNPVTEEKVLNWAPPEQSYADRRGAIRREGSPVHVTIASSTFRSGFGDGVILDRSTGGLRIIVAAAIAPGTTMQVRAAGAPDTVGFVTVIVRSCRKNGDFFEVGCEFEKTPPWNVLLLFG